MITKETYVDILVYHRQGLGIKAIARKLGISKNTVKKYLKQKADMPKPTPRKPKPTKLEPYHVYLKERIEYAKPDWIPATVLLMEIKQQGYTGGITRLREWLTQFKTPTEQPIIRFETEPAEQMQIDFTSIQRGSQTIKAFVATLGYSRATYVKFFENEKVESWVEGLIESFYFFGGIPKTVLCDNAKAIVIERNAYGSGQHKWNNDMLELSKEYGFKLRLCKPYRAQTKGKVERFNGYLKSSFITPLKAELKAQRLALDIEVANAKIGPWLHQVAHQRIHGTTGEKPQDRLDKEKQFLQPLPQPNDIAQPVRISDINHEQTPRPTPHESIQHNLSVYDSIIGGCQ